MKQAKGDRINLDMSYRHKQIVKVRWIKQYPGARNHVCVGELLEEAPQYIKVRGKIFHFGKTSTIQAVKTAPIDTVLIPWNRIEVIHVLSPETDWETANFAINDQGNLVIANPQGTTIGDKGFA